MTPEELRRATAPGLTPQSGTGSDNPAESSGGWNPFGFGTPKRAPTFVPEAAGGRGAYRVKDDNGNWVNLRPDELTQNGTNYSDGGQETANMRNHLKGIANDKKNAIETGRVRDAENKRYNLELTGLQAQIAKMTSDSTNSAAQIGILSGEVKNRGAQIAAQTQLGKDQLTETTNARIDAAAARDADNRLRTLQVERSNDLLEAKLSQEGQQFERQLTLDEKNSRRTQVMGALTLIAQSAAKF